MCLLILVLTVLIQFIIFPSKLHLYLSFPKLVISTRTAGLAPIYQDAIIPLKELSYDAVQNAIKTTLTMSPERIQRKLQSRNALISLKSSHRVAQNFLEFLETITSEEISSL
jgi:trehalose-6-phosphate synthase